MKLKSPKALPLRAFQTNTILYTWEDWHRDAKKEYPIRYFVTKIIPSLLYSFQRTCFSNPIYWLKCHTYRRYHMLDLRHSEYKYGYSDPRQVMLNASFAALVAYVDEIDGVFLDAPIVADPDHLFDQNWHDKDFERQQEIKALYEFWTITYPELVKIGTETYEIEQFMLHRLIEVRGCLWT
jgi:hypothetical protein